MKARSQQFSHLILRRLCCLFLLVGFIVTDLVAQDHYPTGLWLGYTLRKPVAKKLSWNNDIQLRFMNTRAFYDYTLVRTGLQYEANKDFSTTAGILYGQDNYSDKALPVWKNEKRVWEECRYFIGKLTRLQMMLQFRLEERWFAIETQTGNSENEFALRFRHRLDLRRSLSEKWRLVAGDEVMFQSTKKRGANFNQNRTWLGASRIFRNQNELSVQVMQIFWAAPDATILRINFLQQL
jgi:hypothetical protein